MMDIIKLIIWDLDETFWKGTLSEEGVVPIQENIQLIKELTDRGIVNSIVSKNTFDQAEQKLKQLGVWEYFIFPSIEWSPKGPLIKELIQKCNLREANVLFLDDNHLNLEEAKFYCPGLHVWDPKEIHLILEHPAFSGKEDSSHSRLNQYKILEKKFVSREGYSDNVSFLKESNIQVTLLENESCRVHVDRITELLQRTNQLNFTKLRWNKGEVEKLLLNNRYRSGVVNVKDKFGDYGIVGFYSLDTIESRVTHFTFSCRILNLGVESFLYHFLGRPAVSVIPDVAVELSKNSPDWITLVHGDEDVTFNLDNSKQKDTIFFKGGCDLSQMLFYMESGSFRFISETNYPAENNFPIHQEHSQVLVDSLKLSQDKKDYVIRSKHIPFVDESFYSTELYKTGYKAVIYSLLMDYTNELYYNEERDLTLPLGGYYNHWSDSKNDQELKEKYNKKGVKLEPDTFVNFRREFRRLGQISPEKFKDNLHKIRDSISPSVPLIFMNGAELDSPVQNESGAFDRHVLMNQALEQFISESFNTYLFDVRKVVNSSDMLGSNIRHYTREAYMLLARELNILLEEVTGVRLNTKTVDRFRLPSLIKRLYAHWVK